MRIFFGVLIGLVIAAAIAATAMKVAWGDMTDLSERDHSADVSQTIDAADFDKIEIAGVFNVDVKVGGDYSVTLSGRPEDLAAATARVESGVLILDTESTRINGKRKLRNHGISAVIAMPALSGFSASGVVDGEIAGVAADLFETDLSGVGDIEISGECKTLDADVSGVGELDAENFRCETVTIDVSGVGGASVFASKSVVADISGVGKVEVYGSPANVETSKSSPFGRIDVK